MNCTRSGRTNDALPFVKDLIGYLEGAMMGGVMARGTDRNHVVGHMRFVHGPMLDVVDVYSPIRTAWVGALTAGLIHKDSL